VRVASSPDTAKNAVELRISDTGPGIPDEVRARIFEPFFTTKKTGTGLGLAVAYGIIERHHGQIRIDTARAKGTTFSVSVPIGGTADDD
jgi:signal transduction histidine kinase